MNYYSALLINVVTPLLILLAILCSFTVQAYMMQPEGITTMEQHIGDKKDSHWGYVQGLLFLCYPGVSYVVLQAYNCRLIEGEWYLVADLSEICYTDKWTLYAVLACIGVCLYPLGILLYTGTVLRLARCTP